jgi:hypothetical protein
MDEKLERAVVPEATRGISVLVLTANVRGIDGAEPEAPDSHESGAPPPPDRRARSSLDGRLGFLPLPLSPLGFTVHATITLVAPSLVALAALAALAAFPAFPAALRLALLRGLLPISLPPQHSRASSAAHCQ